MEITSNCPTDCKYIVGGKCIATECKREASTTYIIHKCDEEYCFYPEKKRAYDEVKE